MTVYSLNSNHGHYCSFDHRNPTWAPSRCMPGVPTVSQVLVFFWRGPGVPPEKRTFVYPNCDCLDSSMTLRSFEDPSETLDASSLCVLDGKDVVALEETRLDLIKVRKQRLVSVARPFGLLCLSPPLRPE